MKETKIDPLFVLMGTLVESISATSGLEKEIAYAGVVKAASWIAETSEHLEIPDGNGASAWLSRVGACVTQMAAD